MVEWVFYTLLYRKNPLFNLLCLWNHTHILYLMLNRDTVLGFTTTLKFIPFFTHTSLTVGTDHHISSHHQYRAFIQMKQNKADPYKTTTTQISRS